MLRRFLLLTTIAVSLAIPAAATPASAATCSYAIVVDIPPLGASPGDFAFGSGPFFVPASSVGAVQSFFSALTQIPLPPGSTKAVVASCV